MPSLVAAAWSTLSPVGLLTIVAVYIGQPGALGPLPPLILREVRGPTQSLLGHVEDGLPLKRADGRGDAAALPDLLSPRAHNATGSSMPNTDVTAINACSLIRYTPLESLDRGAPQTGAAGGGASRPGR
jgi:hypothetical protein